MYKLRQPSGLLCFQLAFSFCGASPILPMVDLGYQIHQAISFNVRHLASFPRCARLLSTFRQGVRGLLQLFEHPLW